MAGEAGNRNDVRGPGFAGLDMALSKRRKMPYGESHNLLFLLGGLQRPELETL